MYSSSTPTVNASPPHHTILNNHASPLFIKLLGGAQFSLKMHDTSRGSPIRLRFQVQHHSGVRFFFCFVLCVFVFFFLLMLASMLLLFLIDIFCLNSH
jgi:hypothetical protein